MKFSESAIQAAQNSAHSTCATTISVAKRWRYRIKIAEKRKHPSLSNRWGKKNIIRKRKLIQNIHRELGDVYFRRAYRMSYLAFKKLYSVLKPHLLDALSQTEKKRVHAPNGKIPLATRIGCGLRYFAGADPYDLVIVFGISHSSVYNSIDAMVEAVNKCEKFKIEYPEDHEVQQWIADGFKSKSGAGFDCCAGAIDGILIWTHQPSKKDCELTKVGQRKWYCSRKGKYGINLQAVCDHEYRFRSITMLYGGSSSDLLSFEASNLRTRLQQEGFLKKGLCIFGDNAYVNRTYMATPYPNVPGAGELDNYNFYHSQLRIRIECSFGILVNRWGFLRKIAPQLYPIKKTIAVVCALCRLHNFCIDLRTGNNSSTSVNVPEMTDEDELELALEGAVPMVRVPGCESTVPQQLLGNGSGGDNVTSLRRLLSARQRYTVPIVENNNEMTKLPRERMCDIVAEQGLRRPTLN